MLARVYVCGRTCIEATGRCFDERAFPARQGRLAWTYLVLERHRTVTRQELIDAVWGDDVPPACERALSAILSKLRALLEKAGFPEGVIQSMSSSVRLLLPGAVWIDLETAYADIERANRCLSENDARQAYGWALASYMIAREELLPGEEAAWLVHKRNELFALLMQSIDRLILIYTATGNIDMALKFGEEAITRDPLRESAYRQLMRLHAAGANNGGVVSAFERCCTAFTLHVGGHPSAATDVAYHEALEQAATSHSDL